MQPTKAELLHYVDIIEDEIRKALQEVVEDRREVEPGSLADLVTAAVAERMHPGALPNIEAIRRHIRHLFEPASFDDQEGPDPLAVLAAIRADIAKEG